MTHRHDALKQVVVDTTELLVEETNEGTFGEAPRAVLQTHGMGAIYSDEVEFILRRNVRACVDPRVLSCCLLWLEIFARAGPIRIMKLQTRKNTHANRAAGWG